MKGFLVAWEVAANDHRAQRLGLMLAAQPSATVHSADSSELQSNSTVATRRRRTNATEGTNTTMTMVTTAIAISIAAEAYSIEALKIVASFDLPSTREIVDFRMIGMRQHSKLSS